MGIDTRWIVRGGERMGLYFFETGANQRASMVIYDRSGSAIANARTDAIDWEKVFAGASWFHITGITPAISQTAADLALLAVQKAKVAGLTVSCDDIQLALGVRLEREAWEQDVQSGHLSVEWYKALAEAALAAYPNLKLTG
jgi:2-dehydro-3-deoxygluconokinase